MTTDAKQEVNDFVSYARDVLRIEQQAIDNLINNLNQDFSQACNIILACTAKVIVTGMGKSGHIARKIAATLASTGTPAFFIHPSEAAHGDMGMICSNDVVIAISNSGETEEVLLLINHVQHMHIPVIAMTSRKHSRIAKRSLIHLHLGIDKEACPLGLTPTASTTATLALGDALAISCLQARGFTRQDFIKTHPSGSLGTQNKKTVSNIMCGDKLKLPVVAEHTPLTHTLQIITEKAFGMAVVLKDHQWIKGIITDGDIRRMLITHQNDQKPLSVLRAAQIMTTRCITIPTHTPIQQALDIMSEFQITTLIVEQSDRKFAGIVHMHDLIKALSTKKQTTEAVAC